MGAPLAHRATHIGRSRISALAGVESLLQLPREFEKARRNRLPPYLLHKQRDLPVEGLVRVRVCGSLGIAHSAVLRAFCSQVESPDVAQMRQQKDRAVARTHVSASRSSRPRARHRNAARLSSDTRRSLQRLELLHVFVLESQGRFRTSTFRSRNHAARPASSRILRIVPRRTIAAGDMQRDLESRLLFLYPAVNHEKQQGRAAARFRRPEHRGQSTLCAQER